MSGQWTAVPTDDDFSQDCADRQCDDCRAEDCVCACHLADDTWEGDDDDD
jgi:hypothetical protein